MSYRPQLPLHTNLSPQDVAQALTEPNAVYTLLYWNLNGVASTAREILVYGKADYKFESATKKQWWANETPSPFACLSVLTNHASKEERAFENVNTDDDDRKLDAKSCFLKWTLPTFIHNH
ncbi:hypothetical protein BG006_007502 [Podila minutissima]|uniref:Uncharacterized protein n=1 Tax=Podila minutissima TaxID=64525 RepID=A0A9P5VKT3_9FUNG|nr:hypothetical protein BG006_007502 [Podila minutissima]